MTTTPEREIQNNIRLDLGKRSDVIVWRNSRGVAIHDNGSHIPYGLGAGSADLVGLVSSGRFLGLEVKTTKGKPTTDQKLWMNLVNRAGGYAVVVRSTADARDAVTAALEDRDAHLYPLA